MTRPRQGFTLIEIMVAVGIVGVLTVLLTVGYPSARNHQQLLVAEQDIQSQLYLARQSSLNEERDAECLAQFAADDPLRRRCSNVGVSVVDHTVTVYADTTGDLVYSAGADYVLLTRTLVPAVEASGVQNFQFVAAPPTVQLFVDGQDAAGNNNTLQLRVADTTVAFISTPLGELQRQ